MKKLLMQFSDNFLSRTQMKSVKGGDGYGGGVGCWCVYALTETIIMDGVLPKLLQKVLLTKNAMAYVQQVWILHTVYKQQS
ncbi:MAG: hypothetical protein R2822_02120 [Spirosomataceae bacterium]